MHTPTSSPSPCAALGGAGSPRAPGAPLSSTTPSALRWTCAPVLALGLVLVLVAACAGPPGFAADGAGAGPALTVAADVEGGRATLHVRAHGLGEVLGVSAHLRVDPALVAVDDAAATAFLGDDARTLAHVDGADVALGGSHTSAVQSAVADGDLATVEVHGVDAGASRVELVDALARTADGAFVPLAAAGGTLTLEVSR